MRNTPLPPGELELNAKDVRTFLGDLSRDVMSLTSKQIILVAEAIKVDIKYVSLDSTAGAFAVTLAAPNDVNVMKVIEMTVDSGDVTMALTNVVGGSAATTATWNDVGDILVLISTDTKWVVLKELGVVLT